MGSINTGLPPNIVEKLVEAERMPIKVLNDKKGKLQEQQKLVDDLTGKVREIFSGLRELSGTKGFDALKLQVGDPNVLGGTVDRTVAQDGSYQVEVIKLAHKTSAVSNGFPDKNESEVGVGYIKYQTKEGTREIYIDGNNNTLEKVAAAINQKNIGIRASVIKDPTEPDAPYKLMLTGKEIGTESQVEFPTFYFLDGDQDFYIDTTRPAENGKVKIDGVEIDISDNKLVDVIPGVTLDLKQAAPGREINVSVNQDKEVIVGKIKTFVDQVNGVLSFIQQQNSLNKDSDTTRTLGGDSLLRNVESRFREILQGPVFGVSGSIKSLSEVGISFQRNGQLQFNEEKFNNAVSRDVSGVAAFFGGDGLSTGFVPRMRNMINTLLDPMNGPLTQRGRGMKSKMDSIEQQIGNKERQVAQREVQLRNQFARLEETMSRLKSQGQFIQARMGVAAGEANFGNVKET